MPLEEIKEKKPSDQIKGGDSSQNSSNSHKLDRNGSFNIRRQSDMPNPSSLLSVGSSYNSGPILTQTKATPKKSLFGIKKQPIKESIKEDILDETFKLPIADANA
jgi:hypothetical protein